MSRIPFFTTYISPLILSIWFAWVVSIGYNGQDYLRDAKISWLTKKKFILRVYYVLILFVVSVFIPPQEDNTVDTKLLLILTPVTIIGVYCIYYIFIASAVIITTIEHRRKAEFSTTFGHFLRLLIFPLGVYGIQEILNRELSNDDITLIAATYHNWRTSDADYQEVQGFCKCATIEEIRNLNYALTPGRYIGLPDDEDDFNFAERFTSLKAELEKQISEEDELNKRIAKNLSKIVITAEANV